MQPQQPRLRPGSSRYNCAIYFPTKKYRHEFAHDHFQAQDEYRLFFWHFSIANYPAAGANVSDEG